MKNKNTATLKKDNVLKEELSKTLTTVDKIKLLNSIKIECNDKIKDYTKRYKRMKKLDDVIDVSNTILNSSSISCTILGIGIPPLLVVSASLSGISFIMSQVQTKYNIKRKCEQHNTSINQYSNIVREIMTVLSKNNLSSEEYHIYIVEVYDKISLIEDSSLI
jgi:hypothetical protein